VERLGVFLQRGWIVLESSPVKLVNFQKRDCVSS